MNTKTVAAVVAVIAAAIIGGAVIWAVSDDGSTREAVIESTRPSTGRLMLDMPQVSSTPFAVDSFSVGATRTVEPDGQTRLTYEKLEFTSPIDSLSLRFLQRAQQAQSEGNVRLTVSGAPPGSSKLDEWIRYEFGGTTHVESGDEKAPGTKPTSAAQTIGMSFTALQLLFQPELPYADSKAAVGRLEIPNVIDKTPAAYLLTYSWGWARQMGQVADESLGRAGQGLSVKSITIERQLDRHAEWFWQQVVNGTVTPQIRLHLERPTTTGQPETYMEYRLNQAQFSAVHDSGGADGQLRQRLTLNFQSISLLSGGDEVAYPQ
jgi:type VI protein secretion system component Hcp